MVVCSAVLWVIAMNKVKNGTAPAWMSVQVLEESVTASVNEISVKEIVAETEENTEELMSEKTAEQDEKPI